MGSEGWIEVAVRVAPADAEMVADLLGGLAPGGAVMEPAIRISDGEHFGYELLDAPSTVRAFFAKPFVAADRRTLRRRLARLPLRAPLPRLRFTERQERNWAEEWKRFFEVLHVGERLVVRPSWRQYEPRAGEIVIDLDPGSAFGTGQHPTTRLCLEALERELRPGDEVIDVGTGSGILAVAAALLGAGSVRAVDVDPGAVPIARASCERNRVEALVRVAAGSLGKAWPWPRPAERSADLVVANISSAALAELMPDVAAALRPGGRFVGSGFIERHAAEVGAAAADAGLGTQRVHADGEWRCLVACAA